MVTPDDLTDGGLTSRQEPVDSVDAEFAELGRAASSRDAPQEPLPQRIGKYSILGVLGEGGMGKVYRARQQRPNREVALKVIRGRFSSPKLLRRFEHEAEVLGRLQHVGIAQIYEAGTFGDGG